jgi:hypothetical protein
MGRNFTIQYILLITICILSYSVGFAQTDVDDCVSGVVDTNAEDGILVHNDCGILSVPVGTVSGNIEIKGSGDLTINANINLVTGNIEIKAGASLTINADILNINGSIINNGTLLITGNITSEGKLEIKGNGVTTLDGGSFTSTGDGVVIKPNATINMLNMSTITAADDIDNKGTITSDNSGNTIDAYITGNGTVPPALNCGSPPCTDGPTVTITLTATDDEICSGIVVGQFPYSATSGDPDVYSIDFDATAEGEGFVDVTDATLAIGAITLSVPGAATAGVYNALLTVKDVGLGITSPAYSITVTVVAKPEVTLITDNMSLCYDSGGVTFQLTATVVSGSANYDYEWTELGGPHGSITSPINVSNSGSATNVQNYNVTSEGNPTSIQENYNIQVEVTDGNGCSNTASEMFTVFRLPVTGLVYKVSNGIYLDVL